MKLSPGVVDNDQVRKSSQVHLQALGNQVLSYKFSSKGYGKRLHAMAQAISSYQAGDLLKYCHAPNKKVVTMRNLYLIKPY